MCLAKGHNTVKPVRLEPAAPRSQVSTLHYLVLKTEWIQTSWLLRSQLVRIHTVLNFDLLKIGEECSSSMVRIILTQKAEKERRKFGLINDFFFISDYIWSVPAIPMDQSISISAIALRKCRGQKFHSWARNYEWNLERTSNSSQSTHPVGS